ncbi:hypothetical protein ACFQ2Y_06280 [Streptomyces malaysiensis subsp. malaysiensis]
MPTTTIATARLSRVIGMSKLIGVSFTWNPIMAMKCIVQMPEPIDADPSASQPGFQEGRLRTDRAVQRKPRAAPRQAMR